MIVIYGVEKLLISWEGSERDKEERTGVPCSASRIHSQRPEDYPVGLTS
jgi:hypothetical protein